MCLSARDQLLHSFNVATSGICDLINVLYVGGTDDTRDM